MKKIINIQLLILIAMLLVGCNKTSDLSQQTQESTNEGNVEVTQEIPIDASSDWITRGNEKTGYVSVPYNWTEEEYEFELEGNYSLMLISPERNAMVSLIENNYGYDPKQYDSQDPAEYIMESYVAQYESRGGAHINTEKVEIAGYTFYKATDCYSAGSYADYDYYLYTYVAFTGDRFFTIVVEGDKSAVEDIVLKVEEGFSANIN